MALVVPNVSIINFDTAYRMPSRTAFARPNAIVCKFVRLLAKEQIKAVRREAVNVQASQLGFQELHNFKSHSYEGKKFKSTDGLISVGTRMALYICAEWTHKPHVLSVKAICL